jgi:hypothetical protein
MLLAARCGLEGDRVVVAQTITQPPLLLAHPIGGCNGATQELAFGYIAGIPPAGPTAPGITLEADYPYTAQTGKCNPSKIKPAATFQKCVVVVWWCARTPRGS